jgi:DNA-binding ferritin-like protein
LTTASKLKQTLAGLKSAQATLKEYAEKARHDEAKATFQGAHEVVGGIVQGLEERVSRIEFEEPQFKG